MFLEKQAFDFGTPIIKASLPSALRYTKVHKSGMEADVAIIFDAFVNAVERLEGLLDKETAMLIEHRTIALDEFNHKKRHALLELSRAMEAVRGADRDCLTRDLKAALAGLREKLQKNLAILQTHLDAVGAIAAIISRAIQEHESDGTYTPELGRNGRSHEAANCHRHLDNRCYDGGGICEFRLGIPEHRKRSAYKKGGDLERKKTMPLNVPMIANGIVEGYIVAQFIYLADARKLKELAIVPDDFITDEAFRLLYSSKVDFAHLEKYDLQGLTTALTQKINLRFGNEIIKEVLVEEFTYVPKRDISR